MRLTPLEAVLNRNIAASSVARSLCQRLAGRVLALHVSGLPLSIYFESHGESMSLQTAHAGTPAATLSGTPLSFLRLVGPAPETALRAGTVQIQGDAEVAQAFSDLLRAARPDLEEELSRIIGDIAAHQVGNVARSALGLAQRASDTLIRNVAEYLQEEGREVPSRTEAEEFLLGVDTLRDAVDRLEARINLVAQRRRGQQR